MQRDVGQAAAIQAWPTSPLARRFYKTTSIRATQHRLNMEHGCEVGNVDQSRRCTFLDLPYELRQNILQIALRRNGTCHLQIPIWGQRQDCLNPLFEVCRSLREEALEAFYKINMFCWYLNIWDHDLAYSDPASYPLREEGDDDLLLAPAVPWRYPYLFKHLRRLTLRIEFPIQYKDQQSQDLLSNALLAVVQALDFGQRLQQQDVYFGLRNRGSGSQLDMRAHRMALEPLTKMEIPGWVRVTAFPNTAAQNPHAAFAALGLSRIMTARS